MVYGNGYGSDYGNPNLTADDRAMLRSMDAVRNAQERGIDPYCGLPPSEAWEILVGQSGPMQTYKTLRRQTKKKRVVEEPDADVC